MSLKIAILGTKGIPNRYGGFEQFAEYLSTGLAEKGYDITVYAPHYHSFQGKEIKKVKIKHFYCPERYFGGAAHFIYDHLCLKDAIKSGFDLIYEAGYGSCAFAIRYFKKRIQTPIIITNMDGMEWQRKKWNPFVQLLTRKAESIAVKYSDFLIADNLGIKSYFEKHYGVKPVFLPYGANVARNFDDKLLSKYSVQPKEYFLVIARLEPENSIETIIKGYVQSNSKIPMLIVGGLGTKHAKKLLRYATDKKNLVFLGGIYDQEVVDTLRHFCRAYFHGHSVGGTNPSLLEAMACQSFIIAHDNEFNRSVLENNAIFFTDPPSVEKILIGLEDSLDRNEASYKKRNLELINSKYKWASIIDDHEIFFNCAFAERRPSSF